MVAIDVGEIVMLQSQPLDILIVGKLKNSLGAEACSVAEFLVLLQELDTNRAWARLGYASLFDFCHLGLNLTRAESYSRTRLARLAAEVPQVISLLKSGLVSLSVLRILAPVLNVENFAEVLERIRGKSTREVEDFRNAFRPTDKPAARGVVRTIFSVDKTPASEAPVKIPDAVTAAAAVETTEIAQIAPLAATVPNLMQETSATGIQMGVTKTVRSSLTLGEKQWEKYKRVCDISNHSSAGGDVAAVMEMLLDDYLRHHDVVATPQERTPQSKKNICSNKCENIKKAKETKTRYIPKAIRREVRLRDSEQCSYVDSATGRRCECKRGLQYDHIKPFALGGVSDSPQNLRLLCQVHNRIAAENIFGANFMSQKLRNC
jgi:5-methylcytosine-specific restriction endonuclease McrA